MLLRSIRHAEKHRLGYIELDKHFELRRGRARSSNGTDVANKFHQGDIHEIQVFSRNHLSMLFNKRGNNRFG